jgi:hypothetical protein
MEPHLFASLFHRYNLILGEIKPCDILNFVGRVFLGEEVMQVIKAFDYLKAGDRALLAFRDADLILFRGKRVTGTCFTS